MRGCALTAGHIFGKPTKKEFCYDNLRISRNAWDTNLVKVRETKFPPLHQRTEEPFKRSTRTILRSSQETRKRRGI